jgi:hypothetical protein
MNRIVHQHNRLKSTLCLGKTYRMTIGALGKLAQTFLASRSVEAWESSRPGLLKALKKGMRVMLKIGDLRAESTTITFEDAYNVLKICYLLTEQPAILTGRHKSMLRESLWIFADCAPIPLKVACVLPFKQLNPDLQKIPVVAKHYPGIEARADLNLEAYVFSLADALDLLYAIREIRGFKVVLLRHSLEEATLPVRVALGNIHREKS